MVLTTYIACPVLTVRQKEIHVVASDVILREIHDGHRQALFAVMVCSFLGYVTHELSDLCVPFVPRQLSDLCEMYKNTNLDLALELPLEAAPDHLPLTRLETIGHRRNRPHVIRVREQDQLFIDKLLDADLPCVVVQERPGLHHTSRLGLGIECVENPLMKTD